MFICSMKQLVPRSLNCKTRNEIAQLPPFCMYNFVVVSQVLPMPPLSAEFDVDARFEPNVGVLTLFPGGWRLF